METLPKRHLRVNGAYFNECKENIDMWIEKNPFNKYYKNSKQEFWFYACHTPIPGQVHQDENVYFLEDFRTPERFKEYLDCGLNVLYLQPNNTYSGEDFETSDLKMILDNAKKGGIDKVIVCDSRIHALSGMTEPIVGKGRSFETYEELVEFVKECIKPYKDYGDGIVKGVMLVDEPVNSKLPQASLMFKAVTDAWEGVYVDQCLLPLDPMFLNMDGGSGEFSADEKKAYELAYEKHVENFLTWSNAKYFMMDSYPLKGNKTKNGDFLEYICPTHFKSLQLLNRICKKHGAEFYGVSNTCELSSKIENDEPSLKWPTEDEMYWQNNAYIMFGVKMFQYYTYWSKTFNNKGGYHIDGKAFITLDGQKTEMYYFMQRMHKEMQKFAKVIKNFNYQKVDYSIKERVHFSTNYLDFDETAEDFGNFKAVKIANQHHSSVALMTELYDEKNDQLMYCLMNPQHPSLSRFLDNSLEITLEFDSKYRAVELWHNGEMITMGLNKNKIKFNLDAGHAVYILPY